MVIGTPGRIKDLSLDAQALQITTAKTFVVDEADMTLEFGYLEDIDAVAGKMADDANDGFLSNDSTKSKTIFKEIYAKSNYY